MATAQVVARKTDAQYNPLVIRGEGGSGKSHLLRAIANEMSKSCSREQMFFGTVDELRDFRGPGTRPEAASLRARLESILRLLVDDFHRIQDNPLLQDEMVMVIDAFRDSDKQIVLCVSDKALRQGRLKESLRSRLDWGLSVTLKNPDLDVRVKYIQARRQSKKMRLTREQTLLLAQRFTDFRSLQGVLHKLFAFKELMGAEIREEEFQSVLQHAGDNPASQLSAETIIKIVAEHFQLEPAALLGADRRQGVARPRQTAMFLCRELIGCSYPELGKLFGGKDHSTVMYGVKKVKQLQHDDEDMKKMLAELKKKCLLAEG